MKDDSLSIAQSPLWGLGRVIAVEHPELRCTKVDLSPPGTIPEIQALAQELRSEDEEDQIALRGEERWVPRVSDALRSRRRNEAARFR